MSTWFSPMESAISALQPARHPQLREIVRDGVDVQDGLGRVLCEGSRGRPLACAFDAADEAGEGDVDGGALEEDGVAMLGGIPRAPADDHWADRHGVGQVDCGQKRLGHGARPAGDQRVAQGGSTHGTEAMVPLPDHLGPPAAHAAKLVPKQLTAFNQ